MISRILITCLPCGGAITTRVNIGHDEKQPVTLACPHCGTDLKLTLLLGEPPSIDVRFDENCELGSKEGKVVNIGAHYVIPADRLHEDKYFPSFHAPRPDLSGLKIPKGLGPLYIDAPVFLGTLPNAAEAWRVLQQSLRFRKTAQRDNEEAKLNEFFGAGREESQTLEFGLYAFLTRFMSGAADRFMGPLVECLRNAKLHNPAEYERFVKQYSTELKTDRFTNYSELFTEYFKAYGEFSQTLVYARNQVDLPVNPLATSTDFDRTKMYYGNAFELLGSSLDFVAAINNILEGRAFDQMKSMDLKQYRGINKAGRTTCFASNVAFTALVSEYDSVVRNASHHRWFKLNDRRTKITYRSGGTGAEHQMSYAEYLTRCNSITLQVMALAALELQMLKYEGISI